MRLFLARLWEKLTVRKSVTAEDVKGLFVAGAKPQRSRLPNRRMSMRERVEFEFSAKVVRSFEVTFGFDGEGAIREIFCAGAHTQSDLQGIIHDACIAASIALQHGARIADLAQSFGELRDEGAEDGPPASPLGAIARAGAALELEMAEAHA